MYVLGVDDSKRYVVVVREGNSASVKRVYSSDLKGVHSIMINGNIIRFEADGNDEIARVIAEEFNDDFVILDGVEITSMFKEGKDLHVHVLIHIKGDKLPKSWNLKFIERKWSRCITQVQ